MMSMDIYIEKRKAACLVVNDGSYLRLTYTSIFVFTGATEEHFCTSFHGFFFSDFLIANIHFGSFDKHGYDNWGLVRDII